MWIPTKYKVYVDTKGLYLKWMWVIPRYYFNNFKTHKIVRLILGRNGYVTHRYLFEQFVNNPLLYTYETYLVVVELRVFRIILEGLLKHTYQRVHSIIEPSSYLPRKIRTKTF